jgi:hypothetical protein
MIAEHVMDGLSWTVGVGMLHILAPAQTREWRLPRADVILTDRGAEHHRDLARQRTRWLVRRKHAARVLVRQETIDKITTNVPQSWHVVRLQGKQNIEFWQHMQILNILKNVECEENLNYSPASSEFATSCVRKSVEFKTPQSAAGPPLTPSSLPSTTMACLTAKQNDKNYLIFLNNIELYETTCL